MLSIVNNLYKTSVGLFNFTFSFSFLGKKYIIQTGEKPKPIFNSGYF